MVLLTVLEYPDELETDIEKMKKQKYTNKEIIDCMYELKNALTEKINELDNGW